MITNYENFRQTIIQIIQNCGLDVGVIYFIFKDIYNQVEKTYYAQLNKESMQQAQTQIKEQEVQNSDCDNTDKAEENK